MAPGYRANNQSRRSGRPYVDHDVFEGLPVRNWRRDIVNIAPPPVHEISTQKDKWDVELPWGMPKDSQLLPQHSQDLLRAARSGRLYVRRQQIEEEEVDAEAALGDKPEKKEDDSKGKGFSVKTWKLVPKHQEGPEIEFLAKRRKGIAGTALRAAIATGPTITKAKVRRVDAAGNTYIEDVVMAEGQALEGELISQIVLADPNTGKPAVDGILAQPTPPRRRPPPPKRKAKGPGRGRKRKQAVAPTSVPGQLGGVKVEAQNDGSEIQNDSMASEGLKREDSDVLSHENENDDTEMGDDNLVPSDEDGEDGSDDDQSEAEGHGDHDEDDIDNAESKQLELGRFETNDITDLADETSPSQGLGRDESLSPDIPLAMVSSMQGHEHGTAGSPLRNVVTFASAFEEHSPDLTNIDEAEAEEDVDELMHDNGHHRLHEEVEDGDMHGAYQLPPNDGFSGGHDGNINSMEHNQDYGDEEEMLLDGDMTGMDFGNVSTEQDPYPEPYPDDDEEIMSVPVQEHQENDPPPNSEALNPELQFVAKDGNADLPALGPSGGKVEEEDTFEDLLGSLEDHLNEQGPDTETEQADVAAKVNDKFLSEPVPDQVVEAPTSSETLEATISHQNIEDASAEEPGVEDSKITVDVGLRDGKGDEVAVSSSEPVAEE